MFAKTLEQAAVLLAAVLRLPLAAVAYFREWLRFRRLANRWPGPRPIPLFGNAFDNGMHLPGIGLMRHFIKEIIRYRTLQLWEGPLRILIINDPEDIQCFLHNRKNHAKPEIFYSMASDVIGEGLLSSNGQVWEQFHKIIAPTFHQDILNTYMPVFNKHTNIFLKLLEKNANGEDFNIKHRLIRVLVDVVIETLIGVPSSEQTQDTGIISLLEKIQVAVGYRILRPWFYPSFIFYNFSSKGREMKEMMKEVQRAMEQYIQQRAAIFKEEQATNSNVACMSQKGAKQRHGLVDSLLLQQAKGVPISDAQITGEVQTAIITGSETIHLTGLFFLYRVAKHPDVQEKLVTELRRIFDGKRDVEVTTNMLRDMLYLEMVIKETLRLHTPGWFIARQAGEDTPLKTSDLVIPVGAPVVLSLRGLHMDPKVFPNPDVFDPERFSPENSTNRNPCAFLSFAMGPRACIGKKYAMMAMKTLFSKTVWKYKILPDPTFEPHLVYGLTTVPENGMSIRLSRRW